MTEKDRAVFFDLRGGEVLAVDVFDAGDVRGGTKSPTVLVLCQDYAGPVPAASKARVEMNQISRYLRYIWQYLVIWEAH